MFAMKRKWNNKKWLPVVAGLVLLQGCSHGLIIESDPDESEVSINGKSVGKTPLELGADELPPKGNLQVQVTKSGMGTMNTILPNPLETGTSAHIMILVPKSEPELNKINRHTGLMIRAHQLFLQGRTLESKTLIDEALLENPNYLYPYLLKGAILFLNDELEAALTQYKKAEAIDPDNLDTRRLIDILNKKIADPKRVPATSSEKAAALDVGGNQSK